MWSLPPTCALLALTLTALWGGACGNEPPPNAALVAPSVEIGPAPDAWFTDVTETAGLASPNTPTYGAAWGDYNGDGAPDLYVTTDRANLLFRNDTHGAFQDVALASSTAGESTSRGAAWGDYDNDGDPDLIVSDSSGAAVFYRNESDADTDTFRNATAVSGLSITANAHSTMWADFNNDGWLDILITAEGDAGGELQLFQGSASGAFANVTAASGLGSAPGGAGALCIDFDSDSDMDIYLPGSGSSSRLYQNDGNGRFSDITESAGLFIDADVRSAASGDFNNDGHIDIFLTTSAENRLFQNQGDGTFEDVSSGTGIAGSEPGWGAAFLDFDNDGHLDLFIAGARTSDSQNVLYRNRGDGTFEDVTAIAGLGSVDAGRAVALADYDRDGDVDIYITSPDGAGTLLRNEIGTDNNWLRITLTGSDSNSRGIGSRVAVSTKDGITRTASVAAGAGYMSQNSVDLVFGLGDSERASISVVWTSGFVQEFYNVTVNRAMVASEGIPVFRW